MCIEKDCKQPAQYNYKGQKAKYCGKHCPEPDKMINVCKGNYCIVGDCIEKAIYNFKDKTKAEYCTNHRDKTNMIDTKHRNQYCNEIDCIKRASFNIDGESKPSKCKDHKEINMIDVVNNKCIADGCKLIPSYNKPGELKALYCKTHKLDDMIDIKCARCIFEGCLKMASFNLPGETKKLYCKEHATDDNMVDLSSQNRLCIYPECTTRACYNKIGEKKGIYCNKHYIKGEMFNILVPRCGYNGCPTMPIYNLQDKKKPIYCLKHKLPEMVNILDKTCKTPLCDVIIGDRYEGYCLYCYVNQNPDKPVFRNYKTKEKTITDYIKCEFPNFTWITDKKVQDGCSKRRPDIYVDLGNQIVIIEIDENQHVRYVSTCENKRIMEISKDFNFRPIIFIRFNPDEYIDGDNNKISSCWTIDKSTGLCSIKKNKIKIQEWNDRLNTLKSQIEYWTDPGNSIDKTVEFVQLFYDIII